MSILNSELEPKRLALVRELMPHATDVGVLLNPTFPLFAGQARDVQSAARVLGLQIQILRANTDVEIAAAFETVAQQRMSALLLGGSPFFDTRRDQLVALAAAHAIPAIYEFRDFAVAGGLMSYGIDIADAYRQVGIYVARILKGAKPADLPVQQPTKFELAINVRTAQALGLQVPAKLLALADEVIE
jgi:putative ABC transport system substrate-binding protein